MNSNQPFKLFGFPVIVSLALVACSAGKVVATEPTTVNVPNITSTGYVCPEPEVPAKVTSTELNLFVRTERIPVEMVECFELVYGIKVNRDEYSSNEDMYARVSAGGSDYDLVLPTDYMIALLTRQDLLQELDHSQLPVLKKFNPSYLDFEFDPGNKYTIPYLVGTDALIINTSMVGNIPKSWADLWKPEYAGRMIFLDDPRSVIGLTLLSLGYDVNSTNSSELEAARKKLIELVPNIKLFDSDSPQTALTAGMVDLGMTWTGEAYFAHRGNPAFQYVFPAEGAILWQDNWSMLKDAPHPDAAYAWLNYINQGNIFWMVLRDFPYTNPNQAALDFAKGNQMKVVDVNGNQTTIAAIYNAYISSPIINVPASDIKNGHRIMDVGEAARLYDDIWLEIKDAR
jgi:spermidine/putrescine-binding protein